MAATSLGPKSEPIMVEQWNRDNLPAVQQLVPRARSTPGPHGPVLQVPVRLGEDEAEAEAEATLQRPPALGGGVTVEDGQVKIFPWHVLETAWRPRARALPARPPRLPQDRWCGRCRWQAAHGGGIRA
jgi:hypothetical protein